MSQQWTFTGQPAEPAHDERYQHIAGAMHVEFARRDFFDRLGAHFGLDDPHAATDEQRAAFDAHRRAQHERDYDQDRERE